MRSLGSIKFFFIFLSLFVILKNVQIFAETTSTVIVPPTSSNFQFSFDSDNKDQIFHSEIVIPYSITYGASISASTNTDNTISVDYFDDLINGIHVMDYIPGSASNGYANAIPVVDLINRNITWQVSNLPAGTIDQLLTFNMRTNSDYRGDTHVTFKVKANMSNQYATLSQLENAKTYVYAAP